MKKILLAFLLLASPSFAAQSYGSGNINDAFNATLVAVNDQICYNNVNLAAKLATVQWTVTAAGSGGITVQISKDYGTNAISGVPYSVLTSTVSANPSTTQWVNNGPVVGTYETAIPNGTTNFCILYQTGGTATTITLSPGKPYTPGSVTATLADVAESGTGVGITATIYDVSGWTSAQIAAVSPTGQVFTARPVDDAGTAISGAAATFTAAAGGTAVFTRTSGNTTTAAVASSGQAVFALLTKRISVALPAGGTVSVGRYRIEVSR